MPDNYFDYLFVPNSESGAKEKRYVRDQVARNGLTTKADLVNGKIPSSQLPSYVDDVLEYNNKSSFPSTGESGKIYLDKSTNLAYRWSGSEYAVISPSLALGETSSTAYRGDRGKTAYDHASAKGSAFDSGMYKITTNAQGHVTAATTVLKSDITGLGIPGQDTTYSEATTSTAGLMSSSDKTKLNGIATGAEVNQNTFSNIAVGSTTISADSKTDTLTLSAGSNITITPDATNDKVTIAATDTNTTYTLTQDSSDGHKFTLSGTDGYSKTITIPDNDTKYTLSSLGIGDVKNYDQSKAIKSITRSGTTFTYTCLDNTTGTFTQQDNDTWIAMVGATSSSNGTAGYVPTPPKDGYNTKFLRADGTWSVPSGSGIGTVTSVNSGTGLTGGPITSTGTLSLDPNYIAKLDGLIPVTDEQIDALFS